MKLKQMFDTRPNETTATISLAYIALIFALIFLMSSCSVVRHEGSTSPCFATKHYVGYGFGGFAKGRMKR